MREYNRNAAVAYAKKWAYGRNPAFYDFSAIGGDCTNYASQCAYAGSGIMNFTPVMGWYYISPDNRTASWTGVQFFFDFMTQNKGVGPFADVAELGELLPGDFVQLGNADGTFYHTPIITSIVNGRIFVAAHSFDAFDRPLDSYIYDRARGIHIVAVRDE